MADADFDHADHKVATTTSVFLTDWHDVECYTFKTSSFERILSEYADREKLGAWKTNLGITDVRSHLLEQAAEIGYLLWSSLTDNIGLNFNGLKVEHFVSSDKLSVDQSEFIKQVLILSGNLPLDTNALDNQINTRRSIKADLWQVARGHDFVNILSFALRTAWKQDTGQLLSSEAMEGVLRTAYPVAEFSNTSLYNQIRCWERSENGGNTILIENV